RNAECLPFFAREFGTMRSGGRGKFVARNVREGDAGFFEHRAFGKDARATATAFGAYPIIGYKVGGSVLRGEIAADGVLQAEQVGFDGGEIGSGGYGHVAKGNLHTLKSEGRTQREKDVLRGAYSGERTTPFPSCGRMRASSP